MNAIVPVSMSEMQQLANAVAKSGMFGIKTADQALVLMAISQAEGMHPAIAARDYHVIQGKPALKADAMLARFQTSGGRVEWTSMTDEKVSAIFSHPQGGSVEIDWDMKRAKSADLGGKEMWKKYPRQMLRARVISEGIRIVYPGVVAGMYTPEEVQDFDTKEMKPTKGEVIDQPRPNPVAPPIVEVPINPETGEVSPHTIPVDGDHQGLFWMPWSTSYAAALKSAKDIMELEAWINANTASVGNLAKEAPKLHGRLAEIILQRRKELMTMPVPSEQTEPGELIDG